MKRAPRLFGGRRRLFGVLAAIGVAQAGAVAGGSLLIKLAFDRLLIHHHGPANFLLLVEIGSGLLAAAGVSAWLRFAERVAAERLGQDYAHDVRRRVFAHLTSQAARTLQVRSRGGLMLRFVGDLAALRQWISLGLARLIVIAVSGAGAILVLLAMNWVLAAAVSCVLAAGTAVAVAQGGTLREATGKSRRRKAQMSANVAEILGAVSVLQIFDRVKAERRRFRRQSERVRDSMIEKAVAAGRIRAATEGTAAITYAAALLAGAVEVGAGRTSAGSVAAALTIVGLLVPHLRDLGRVQQYWYGYRISLHKLEELLKTPRLVKEIASAPNLALGSGRLEFQDVSVEGALEGITATAEPRTVVAVIGPNGAGKSTLLQLAARLIDPSRGVVRLDGHSLASHSLASVRRAIGAASLDLPLMRGTLEQNLRYRWPDAPEEELARVRKLCEIDEVIAELPQGVATRIRDGGAGLSSGQRQRVALARAVLGDPRILLLDEADGSLDAPGDTLMSRILEVYKGTVLLVTHRRDRAAAADAIWYLENGRLIEAGPPAVLLTGTGPTATFFAPRLVAVS